MSNSPQTKNSDPSKDDQVRFKTSDIGRWASQQESPFAKQNRERQAKKQERNKKRQKAAPYIIIISSVIAVGLAVWGLVVLIVTLVKPGEINPATYTPEISGTSTEDITDYRDKLMNFYNMRYDVTDEERLQDVKDAVDRTLSTDNGKEYNNQVRLAEIGFYINIGNYQEVIETEKEINPDDLDIRERSNYYNMLAYSYDVLGNSVKAQEYYDITYDLTNQLEEATGD